MNLRLARSSLPAIVIATAIAAVAGCTGEEEKDPDEVVAGIQTGRYELSGAAFDGPDECDLGGLGFDPAEDADGTAFVIADADDDEVVFETETGPVSVPREGNVIGGVAELIFERDWNIPGTPPGGFPVQGSYACVEEDYQTITFTIVDETSLFYENHTTYTAVSGSAADCIAANSSGFGLTITDWPCETAWSADLEHS